MSKMVYIIAIPLSIRKVLVSATTLAPGHPHLYVAPRLFVREGVWQTLGHRWTGRLLPKSCCCMGGDYVSIMIISQ